MNPRAAGLIQSAGQNTAAGGPVDTAQRHQLQARRAEFEALIGLIEHECAQLPREDRLRLTLVVEELFCNSLEHGYGGEGEHPVWLSLQPSSEGCRVVYEDAAPEHDPFTRARPALADAVEQRTVGGLGVFLLAKYSSWYRYSRQDERNIIELFLPVSSAQG